MVEMDFWRVQVLGTTPSTQDMVRNLADTGEPEGLAIQALQQTKGRGRHGNQWSSPMGNLYLSVLLRPACRSDKVGQMAFVVANALSETLDEFLEDGHTKTLKWPNDVLVDGKKISGILLESKIDSHGRVDYLIVGTGLNIFAPPDGAASLDAMKKERIAINTVRDAYLARLLAHYKDWQDKGFGETRKAWLKQCHGLGQAINIRLPETSYQGVFEGIDDDGALMANIDGTLKKFTAGDVHFGVS